MDLPGVERLTDKNQNEMETEYNNFVKWLFGFVNQEIPNFEYKLVLFEVPMEAMQNTCTQVHKTG